MDAERQRLYYQANKEKIQERRRQLYAEGGNQRDRQKYQRKKDDPEFKAQRALNRKKHYYLSNGYAWPPDPIEQEMRKREKYRKLALANVKQAKETKRKTLAAQRAAQTWTDIPDLSLAVGELPDRPPLRLWFMD